MPDEIREPSEDTSPAQHPTGGEDRILAALAHLRGSLSRDGFPSGQGTFAGQEAYLAGWAESLGLLLNPEDLPAKAVKGGQEHEIWHDESTDRYWKLTKNRVFVLTSASNSIWYSS